MKNSLNRASRIYQRKRRVGKDPKKIRSRIEKIFKTIYTDSLRADVANHFILEQQDLDEGRKMFSGTVETGYTTAADTIDLLVELVGLLKDNQIYFYSKYTKQITLRFENETVSIPWPKEYAMTLDFPFICIIIQDKKFYHFYWYPIELPQNFGYEILPMRKIFDDKPALKFGDFLQKFGLSVDKLQ